VAAIELRAGYNEAHPMAYATSLYPQKPDTMVDVMPPGIFPIR